MMKCFFYKEKCKNEEYAVKKTLISPYGVIKKIFSDAENKTVCTENAE